TVRTAVGEMLRGIAYAVTLAGSGLEDIAKVREHDGPYDPRDHRPRDAGRSRLGARRGGEQGGATTPGCDPVGGRSHPRDAARARARARGRSRDLQALRIQEFLTT